MKYFLVLMAGCAGGDALATIDQSSTMTLSAADASPTVAEVDRLTASGVPGGTDHVTFFDRLGTDITEVATDAAPPWTHAWQVGGNTGNGSHRLTAVAYDASGTMLASTAPVVVSVAITHALDDTQFYTAAAAGTTDFPRTTNTGGNAALEADWSVLELSKLTAVNGVIDARSTSVDLLKLLHDQFGNIIRLRYVSARAFQDDSASPRWQDMFAGHWLLDAPATLDQDISTTADPLTLRVSQLDRITNACGGPTTCEGVYVMLWSPGFTQVEHAMIQSIDVAHSKITITDRGRYTPGGIPARHDPGASIAVHENGAVSSQLYWAYNMSSKCPPNPAHQTMNQVLAAWIGAHLQLVLDAQNGHTLYDPGLATNYDGVLWDISGNFIGHGGQVDVDLDGAVDNGVIDNVNVWGAGMDDLFAATRTQLDTLFGTGKGYLVGGTIDTRGYTWLDGDQIEGFPVTGSFEAADPDYSALDEELAKYSYFMHHSAPVADPARGVRVYSECRNKTPIAQVKDLSSLRLSLGMTLLENGVYSKQTAALPDPAVNIRQWFDEFAVDQNGKAICAGTGTDDLRRTRSGWLGQPSNTRYRILDASYQPSGRPAIDLSTDYLANGGFETGRAGWSQTNLGSLTLDTTTWDEPARSPSGTSLHTGRVIGYDGGVGHATITGPKLAAVPGGSDCRIAETPVPCMTFTFAAKASAVRNLSLVVAGQSQDFIIGTTWQRYVAVLPVVAGSTPAITFEAGRDASDLWLDGVHAYAGNANVFRRDFANGTVIVNMTGKPVRVAIEANAYKRIKAPRADGCQDPTTNSGQCVATSTLDIPSRDSAILYKGCP